jgi:DsbC/DsbD-like thiol-disulfide interchange protein
MHGVTNRAMHCFVAAWAASVLAAGLSAQALGPKPSAVQHVTAAASTAAQAEPRGRIALHLDVTPNPKIHVYGPGAKEFTPVSLVLTPRAGMAVGKPVYPDAPPGDDGVPAYRKAFRITLPVTLPRVNDDVVVSGVLNYQACDDRLCYPVASLPVSWTIRAQ